MFAEQRAELDDDDDGEEEAADLDDLSESTPHKGLLISGARLRRAQRLLAKSHRRKQRPAGDGPGGHDAIAYGGRVPVL